MSDQADVTSLIDPPPNVIVNTSGSCFDYVRVFSSGLWNTREGESLLQHSLFRFNVQLIIFVFLAFFFHSFLKRFHLPRLTSEILAGFVIGPTIFENYFYDEALLLFNTAESTLQSPNVLMASFARIGYVLLAFLTGVRMDPSLLWKTGRTSPILGFLLALFPLLMVMSLDFRFNPAAQMNDSFMFVRKRFVSTTFSMFINGHFIGVSYILVQLRITNSRLGRLALGSQLTTELIGFALTVFRGFKDIWLDVKIITSVHSMSLCVVYVLALFFVVRPLIYYIIRATPEDHPVNRFYSNLMVVVVLVGAVGSELSGLSYPDGPFLIGLLIPAGSPLARDVVAKLESITMGTFIPILVTFCASKFSLQWFLINRPIVFDLNLVGFGLKLMVTFIISLCCKMSVRDAAAFTLIMNNKGVVEIGKLFGGSIEFKDVNTTNGILLVLILSAIIAPLVKILYDPDKYYIGHNKKCIQFAPADTSLNILACVHRQEDAMAVIKLLEFSNPTKESPLSVYGLCLEELVASSTPVLINHELGQKTSSSFGSRSQPMIDIFKYFQAQNKKIVHVHLFTAISHLKQMHEDICWLSFDKATSLIIIPFHKKWNSKSKKLIPGSNDLRNLNIDVLNRAPCSVAILVDRRGTQGLSSIFVTTTRYRVGVVFIGGDDDREALAYALRMAGSSKVEVTVVRLVTGKEQYRDRWENMLDTESLRAMRHAMTMCENICYKEETVSDGSETTTIVRGMEGDFDLIIVGRRHENENEAISGLSEWTELPELGLIGDMLASPDIKDPVSVLVVQQQIMKASHSSVLNG